MGRPIGWFVIFNCPPPPRRCLATRWFVPFAKPVTKAARTATIGRFEATLVRDRAEDRVVQSGIRALDWREAVRRTLDWHRSQINGNVAGDLVRSEIADYTRTTEARAG